MNTNCLKHFQFCQFIPNHCFKIIVLLNLNRKGLILSILEYILYFYIEVTNRFFHDVDL